MLDHGNLDKMGRKAMTKREWEIGEKIVIYSWDGAHRLLASVIVATPNEATIEYGGIRRRKTVPYSLLLNRNTGEIISYNSLIEE